MIRALSIGLVAAASLLASAARAQIANDVVQPIEPPPRHLVISAAADGAYLRLGDVPLYASGADLAIGSAREHHEVALTLGFLVGRTPGGLAGYRVDMGFRYEAEIAERVRLGYGFAFGDATFDAGDTTLSALGWTAEVHTTFDLAKGKSSVLFIGPRLTGSLYYAYRESVFSTTWGPEVFLGARF